MNRKRPWLRSICSLGLIASIAAGCGRPSHTEVLATSDTRALNDSDTKALSNWQEYPALSLVSEWHTIHTTSLELDVGLNWVGFGAGVGALSYFRMLTVGSVELIKHIPHPDSRILRDAEGHIDVRVDQPVAARCQYASQSLIRLEGAGRFSLSGMTIEHERGEAKVLEITTTGKTFDVEDGATLNSLEDLCRHDFESIMRPIVERNMATGIQSKLRIENVADSRVNALRYVLKNEEATILHQGRSWQADPVSIEADGDTIFVKGSMQRLARWGGESYAFHYAFEKTSHKMKHLEIVPRGLDEDSQDALNLSSFLARNAMEWHLANAAGRPFLIDTKSLPKS